MSGPNIDPIQFKKNSFEAWQKRINTPKGNPNFQGSINFSSRPGTVRFNDPQLLIAYNNYCQQCQANGTPMPSVDDFAARYYQGSPNTTSTAAEAALGAVSLGDAISNLASGVKSLLNRNKTKETAPKDLNDTQKAELQQMANDFAAEMQKENGEFSITDLNQFIQSQMYSMNPDGDGSSVNVEQFTKNLQLIDPELTDEMAGGLSEPLADSSGNISKDTVSKLYKGAVNSDGKISGESFSTALMELSSQRIAETDEGGVQFKKGIEKAVAQGYQLSEQDGTFVYTKDGKTFNLDMNTGLPVEKDNE